MKKLIRSIDLDIETQWVFDTVVNGLPSGTYIIRDGGILLDDELFPDFEDLEIPYSLFEEILI